MERNQITELPHSEFRPSRIASLLATVASSLGSVPITDRFASKSQQKQHGCLAPSVAGSVPSVDRFASKSQPKQHGCLAPVAAGSVSITDRFASKSQPKQHGCLAPSAAGSVPIANRFASKSQPKHRGCLAPSTAGSVPRFCVFMLALLIAFFSDSTWAADPNVIVKSQQPFKFELDVQPILTARGCNSGPCHGKSRGQNGFALSLLGFDSDMAFRSIVTDARGRRVQPASPADSLLLQKATSQLPHGGGKKLEPDSADYQTLVQWIQAGFPRINETDPVLTQVAISPDPKPLAPGEELHLKVTATYSDGSSRDVTSTSAYQSNEPAVLAVKPNGKIQAGSLPGEATIMARYMGNIATWSSAIPRPDPVDPKVYAELPRNNFIDDLVYQRLAHLNIVPSRPASDSQFLRRAFIDVIGRQPTSDETRELPPRYQPQ